jgi:hypothetical protein
MKLTKQILWLPGLALVSGLAAGCGGDQVANVPPPKASTPEDQQKAAANVYAGMPKIKAPGAPAPTAPAAPPAKDALK